MKNKNILYTISTLLLLLFIVFGAIRYQNYHSSSKITSSSSGKDSKISRIVITGNCPFSVGMANNNVYSKIVGTGPWTFTKNTNNELGNYTLLKKIKPDIDRINNNFMDKQYTVNSESLLKLKPQKIFYYGAVQNDHLDRFNIPIINLDRDREGAIDPSKEQDYWETTYEKELSLPETHKFKTVWNRAKKQMEDVRKHSNVAGKTGLYVYMVNNKVLRVSGKGSYGDYYLKMAGLKNVASDLPFFADKAQQIDVSEEQLLKWNPDVIIVCFGSAKDIKEGKILNNALANTKAFHENNIISTPVGIHNWGGAGGESSLLPLYITNKLDKKAVDDNKLRLATKNYYKYVYNYDISDSMLNEVLKDR